MAEDAIDQLFAVLEQHGWTAYRGAVVKGGWRLLRDNDPWLVLQTQHNERAFDVGVADSYFVPWMANLVEHLARMEDERARLRATLESIKADSASGPTTHAAATAALAECYHTWLVDITGPRYGTGSSTASVYCPVCGLRRERTVTDQL